MKLTNYLKFGIVATAFVGSVLAQASPTFGASASTLSALKNTGNMFGSGTGYDVTLNTDAGDADLFINGLNLNFGGGWDPNLDMFADIGSGYTFGTAITGGSTLFFNDIANRFGSVDSSVATGFYDFSLEIIGGGDASASGILETLNFQLEVVDDLIYELGVTVTPEVINRGESATARMDLFNVNSRDMVTTSWFYAVPGFANGAEILEGTFVGDWFGKTIASGAGRSDDHTTWTASATQVLGTYTGNRMGIIGGYYNGDQHYMEAAPDQFIEVVPEPASMIALGLGAAALLRRRKK